MQNWNSPLLLLIAIPDRVTDGGTKEICQDCVYSFCRVYSVLHPHQQVILCRL